MYRPKNRWLAASLGAIGALALFGAGFAQSGPPPPGVPLATGLSGPRGITALTGGDTLVAEGAGGRLLSVAADGTVTELLTDLPVDSVEVAPGELETVGISSAISDGGTGYYYVVGESLKDGFSALYQATAGGTPTLIADIGAYEEANNTDDDVLLTGEPEVNSNPYDLVLAADGDIYVTDAGANAVLRIDGTTNAITPFAIFLAQENPLFAGGAGVGGPIMDQVPTGITIGPDGAFYVSTLTGFPFPTGAARVYRLEDGNADGDALDDGEVTVHVEGLTTATDVAFDADGNLLISQFSTNMLAGAPGRISRFSDGQLQTIAHLLVSPTSITVTDAGKLLVSQEFAGMVSDVTDVLPGGFSQGLVPGFNLASYGGGPLAQIQAELAEVGASSLAVSSNGAFVIHIVGAPGFVNADFASTFPDGLPAGASVLVIVATP